MNKLVTVSFTVKEITVKLSLSRFISYSFFLGSINCSRVVCPGIVIISLSSKSCIRRPCEETVINMKFREFGHFYYFVPISANSLS
jgi:hypothetical protein